MRIMVVWLQNFQGGQSPSKYPTYVVQFMISPQMRFSWPKKLEKLRFSNETSKKRLEVAIWATDEQHILCIDEGFHYGLWERLYV